MIGNEIDSHTVFVWPGSVSVMFSRLYLGVHSPADIVCGGIVGCIVLALWIKVDNAVDMYISFGNNGEITTNTVKPHYFAFVDYWITSSSTLKNFGTACCCTCDFEHFMMLPMVRGSKKLCCENTVTWYWCSMTCAVCMYRWRSAVLLPGPGFSKLD